MSFAGFPIEHGDMCVLAVRDLLLENDRLRAWSGGRIYRIEGLAAPKQVQVPYIGVAAAAMEPQHKTGSCLEIVLPVQFLFVWETYRRILEDSEASCMGIVSETMRWMHSPKRYYLKVPRFGERRLTKRLQGWKPVAFDAIREQGDSVTLGLAIAAEYICNVSAATWELRDATE